MAWGFGSGWIVRSGSLKCWEGTNPSVKMIVFRQLLLQLQGRRLHPRKKEQNHKETLQIPRRPAEPQSIPTMTPFKSSASTTPIPPPSPLAAAPSYTCAKTPTSPPSATGSAPAATILSPGGNSSATPATLTSLPHQRISLNRIAFLWEKRMRRRWRCWGFVLRRGRMG